MSSDNKGNSCACSAAPKLIFPCSGGSDVGEITDRAARILTRENIGKMYCLAGIGGKVSGIVATTESADKILVIDGCPLNCAKKTLENAGITKFEHLCLNDIDLPKAKSPANETNINKAVKKCEELLECR